MAVHLTPTQSTLVLEQPRVRCNIEGLQPVSVEWNYGSRPNRAIFRAPGKRFVEDVDITAGSTAVHVWLETDIGIYPLFDGLIWARRALASPDMEAVEYVAYGVRATLAERMVYGRGTPKAAGGVFLAHAPTVFNENGSPNRYYRRWDTVGGDWYTGAEGERAAGLFWAHPQQHKEYAADPGLWWWTLGDMLDYVLNWYTDGSSDLDLSQITQSITQAGVDTEVFDIMATDISVDCRRIPEAVTRILAAARLSWWALPAVHDEEGEDDPVWAPEMRILRSGHGPYRTLYTPYAPTGLAPFDRDSSSSDDPYTAEPAHNTLANFTAATFDKDYGPVVTDIQVLGNPETYEAVFSLSPAWSPVAESALLLAAGGDTDEFFRMTRKPNEQDPDTGATAAEWDAYKEIGRLWRLFECADDRRGMEWAQCGAERATLYEPYDFATLFGSANVSQCPRKFLFYRRTRGDDGTFLPAEVQVNSKPIEATIANSGFFDGILFDGGSLEGILATDFEIADADMDAYAITDADDVYHGVTVLDRWTWPTVTIRTCVRGDRSPSGEYTAEDPDFHRYSIARENVDWNNVENEKTVSGNTEKDRPLTTLAAAAAGIREAAAEVKRTGEVDLPYLDPTVAIGDLVRIVRGPDREEVSSGWQVVGISFDLVTCHQRLSLGVSFR